jgi:hypothetical protein
MESEIPDAPPLVDFRMKPSFNSKSASSSAVPLGQVRLLLTTGFSLEENDWLR